MARHDSVKLPEILVGLPDIVRLLRELETMHDFLHQAALRQTPTSELKLPRTSRLLDEITKLNGLNLIKRDDYEQLVDSLKQLETSGPRIHLAFPTDPSAAFVAKIVAWLRANIDPSILVQLGLEPNLAAGCVVRTSNRQFDLSLKNHFEKARPLLIQKLAGQTQPIPAPQKPAEAARG